MTDDLSNLIGEGFIKRGSEIKGPKIPDAPDIAPPAQVDPLVTDSEFLIDNRYRPHGLKSRSGLSFPIVAHTKEPQHRASENFRERLTGTRPESFYVQAKDGTIGWVPWLGSPVVWPWEAAWAQDLLLGSSGDPK